MSYDLMLKIFLQSFLENFEEILPPYYIHNSIYLADSYRQSNYRVLSIFTGLNKS